LTVRATNGLDHMRRLIVVLGNRDEAEDVAQETYVRAFKSWARFDRRDVTAWLYTIALRLALNQLRSRRRWLGILGRTKSTAWTDRADPDLWIAIRSLDPRIRAALLFNVLDGHTQREIAAMFGVAEGTGLFVAHARKVGAPVATEGCVRRFTSWDTEGESKTDVRPQRSSSSSSSSSGSSTIS